jgi:AbiV family abortive infection protein
MNSLKKEDYYKIYTKAHNNAVALLNEAEILHSRNHYARAYFLAFTGLEEISKSQLAADVWTGFIKEEDFWSKFAKHSEKITRVGWASHDAGEYLDLESESYLNIIWPDVESRMKALYVDIEQKAVVSPTEKITEEDSKSLIHTLRVAIERIIEMTEYWGHQIGTKGFMK